MASSRCLNRRCGRDLQEDWAFCNGCGEDNRPPAARAPVVEDEHHAPVGEYCVRCGRSILDLNPPVDEDENRLQVLGGWVALILGSAALLYSFLERPIGRHGASLTESEAQAASTTYLCARYGSTLLAAGVVLLLVTPIVRRKR